MEVLVVDRSPRHVRLSWPRGHKTSSKNSETTHLNDKMRGQHLADFFEMPKRCDIINTNHMHL